MTWLDAVVSRRCVFAALAPMVVLARPKRRGNGVYGVSRCGVGTYQ